MSELNLNPTPSSPASAAPTSSSETAELKKVCSELLAQTHTLRIVVLLIVTALCLFFWREAGFNGAIAEQMQPQVMQASQYFDMLNKQGSSFEKQMQAIQGAVLRLAEYGRTHPDYVPVLAKYGIPVNTTAAPTAARPAASPAPAPAAPKK